MPIAVKNGAIVLKSGAIATSCQCCKKQGCGTIAGAGGDGGAADSYEVGSNAFTVVIRYEAYGIPDQFVVRAGGTTYLDTGLVSGSGERKFCKPEGVTEIEIEVFGGGGGTAWAYSIECPGVAGAENVTDAAIQIKCAPLAGASNNSKVYAEVCFGFPEDSGWCSNDSLMYEFQLCTYNQSGECVGTSLATFAELNPSNGRLLPSIGVPLRKDEIALYGHSAGNRGCMWLGPFNTLTNTTYGIRIVTTNPGTSERSSGVLLGPFNPSTSTNICSFYASLPNGGFSASITSVTNLGGTLFSYKGVCSFPNGGPADCPQYINMLAASYTSWSNNNTNPTPTSQGWQMILDGDGRLTTTASVEWEYRCQGLVVPDSATGAALVLATDDPCDTRFVKPPLVIATLSLP